MNKYAIYHNTDTPFVYAKDINTLVIRIRTEKEDIVTCDLYYKDRYDWENPYIKKSMKLLARADLFDYFEVEVSVQRNRYKYFFELTDKEDNIICFDERGFRPASLSLNGGVDFQFAYLAEGDLYKESKWLQEAIVYQIFPDRFNNGDESINPEKLTKWGSKINKHSMCGGDLQGIIDKLDYLEELGVNLIYLTPIFKSTSNHKYNTADYYDIDPQFGNLDTAKVLVEACHKKGIKIVFDAVFNHSGDDFFAFEDLAVKGENSRYKDWYFVDKYPINKKRVSYYTFGDNISNMPKLNTNNPEVREYLLKVGAYWVKDIGIDGWRLDVCDEVDHDFWRAFKKAVKAANSNAITIGEIQHEACSFLKGDQLDSIMNYPFKAAVVDFFAKRLLTAEDFEDILAFNRTLYMDSITRQMWNLLGSHDTKRFLTECGGDLNKMKLSVAFQFAYIGVPYIYYGDEIGLEGGDDPECRKCMLWEDKKQNKELLSFHKKIIAVRKENKALTHGDYESLYCKDNVIVFQRSFNGESIVAAFNNNNIDCNVIGNFGLNGEDLITTESINLSRGLNLKAMSFKLIKKDVSV